MTNEEIIKKKRKPKRISAPSTRDQSSTWPTLGSIVLSNGLRVDIPQLPINGSALTSYDNLRIALEHAALAICCLNRLGSSMTPRIADSFNLAPIRLNLEDLLNHLHYAIEGFPSGKESA